MNELKQEILRDPKTGEPVQILGLTPEQNEILKALFESGGWRLYRQILIGAKEGYFHSTLAMKDPNEVMKSIGIVAGINFAVNQLGVLMMEYNKAKSVERETKNASGSQGKREQRR